MKSLFSALTLAILTCASSGVHARTHIVLEENIANCPEDIDLDSEAIEKNIAYYLERKNLYAATKIASLCAAFGSGLDSNLIGPVIDAYEAQFSKLVEKGEMTANQKADLASKAAECSARYAKPDSGSMGRSAAAHCNLKVYDAFDSLYGPRDL